MNNLKSIVASCRVDGSNVCMYCMYVCMGVLTKSESLGVHHELHRSLNILVVVANYGEGKCQSSSLSRKWRRNVV